MEFGNALPHDINISGSSNRGFIVRAGCCTAVFTDKKEMLNAIEDYINDPAKVEAAYNKSNGAPRNVPTAGNALAAGRTMAVESSGPMEDCGQCQDDCAPEQRRY